MQKKKFLTLGIVIVWALMYFVGSGFTKNKSVYIADYSVSADGKEMTINAGVFSSIGYIRDVKVHQQKGGKLCLDFYSAFGGPNGKIGAKDSFTFEINDETTIIAVYGLSNSYEEVLVKDEDGTWKILH